MYRSSTPFIVNLDICESWQAFVISFVLFFNVGHKRLWIATFPVKVIVENTGSEERAIL